MEIKIAHLYPELLNLYGDKGNINALCKRLSWRGIDSEVKTIKLGDNIVFSDFDIVVLGGGSYREQIMVCNELLPMNSAVRDYVENDGVMLATCGGYHILGKTWQSDSETIDGLGILDMYTEQNSDRLMGNVIIDSPIINDRITGFENHSELVYTNMPPLGKILYGNGNNIKDKTEGSIYKNLIGTNLHGPVLPVNPKLADWILTQALTNKYGDIQLSDLDDSYESKARDYIIQTYL